MECSLYMFIRSVLGIAWAGHRDMELQCRHYDSLGTWGSCALQSGVGQPCFPVLPPSAIRWMWASQEGSKGQTPGVVCFWYHQQLGQPVVIGRGLDSTVQHPTLGNLEVDGLQSESVSAGFCFIKCNAALFKLFSLLPSL